MVLKRSEKQGRRYLNPVPTNVAGLGLMLKVIPMYLRNKEERTPKVAPGPFLTDISLYNHPPKSNLRVTWFGHSASLVEIDGVTLLLDPVWDERAAPVRWFGPKRFFAPTLSLDELPRVDAVIFSHDHYDHLGKDTVKMLAKLRPGMRWIVPNGVGKVLRGFGLAEGRVTELDWTQETVVHGPELGVEVTVTMLPARHFSGRSLFNRFHTLWGSYVLRGARHNVYYGADTGYWDGFGEIGRVYGPFDLTMLEIGAYHPLWASIHMGPDAAIKVFEELGGAGLMMPIHWGLFDLALHAWRQPIERATAQANEHGIRLWSPEPGVPTEVVADEEVRSEWWRIR